MGENGQNTAFFQFLVIFGHFHCRQNLGGIARPNCHFLPEYENMMFGARLGALGSFHNHQSIPPKNEVKVEPAKKVTNFSGFLPLFSQNGGVMPF